METSLSAGHAPGMETTEGLEPDTGERDEELIRKLREANRRSEARP